MIVQDLMTPDPATINVTDSIAVAIDILNDLDIRHVPVLDNGVLVGMVSDRDLREFSLPTMVRFNNPDKASARLEAPVSEIMYADVLTVGSESDVLDVIQMMVDHKVGAVPVCDQIEGKLIGIVSYIDVLQAAEDLF